MLDIVLLPINKLQPELRREPIPEIKPPVNVTVTQTTQYQNSTPRNLIFESQLANFKKLANELQTINSISWTLEWDSSVTMPQLAVEDRARQMSYLVKLSHEILTSEEMSSLLKYFEEETSFNNLDKNDQALLREIRSQYKRVENVPTALLQELASTTVKSQLIWLQASEANDFFLFAPELEKIVLLKRQIVEHMGYKGSPYNALIEAYEPGMTIEKLDKLFEELKKELIPMIKKINSLSQEIDDSFLNKSYSLEEQLELGKELLKHIKFDFSKGRLDPGNTSFSLGITPNDVRLVSCIFENNIFYTTATILHEGGHGLYDLGFGPALANTPLFDASSVSMHESQSLLYETIIGQGLPFWKFYFPKLKEHFPEQLKDVSLEQFYKAINKLQSSFTWSAADEIAANLHIGILYEIEKSLIEGKLSAKEVPAFWSKKLEEYFGITPPNDTICSHWSSGDFGYLPTYALGHLYKAQIYNTMKKEIPALEEQIANGDMAPMVEWLREKIHQYGKSESPSEIMTRVTGESLNPKHFLNYIKDKYSRMYNIDL